MDSITQATLGAAIGQAILGRQIGYKGAILGGIVATIPDLDILLLPFYNSIERISIHRGYSHSILFSLVGAVLIALILSKIKWTKQISMLRLFTFSWLALFTHMLLDAFTAYGTQLFLPFSSTRVSFDSVNIVDPVYTLPLLIGLTVTLYQQRKKKQWSYANRIGIVASSAYLLFTVIHKQYITKSIKAGLQEQNISFTDMRTIPVGIGNMHWYGVAKSNDTLYIGKRDYFDSAPLEFHAFLINDDLLQGTNPELTDRLKWVSQGFYTVAQDNGTIRLYNLQCDMQGVRTYGGYKAPTAFYFEIINADDGTYELNTGMHNKE